MLILYSVQKMIFSKLEHTTSNAVSKNVNAARDHKSYKWSSTYLKRKIYTPPVRCRYSTWQGENSYQILE